MTRRVAIFLNQHLPLSEVFVAHQAKSLQHYTPTLLACRQVTPSVQHDLSVHILNKNNTPVERIKEALFKTTGKNRFLKNHVSGHDVIHAHFGPTGWLASPLSKQTKIPLVVTLHGFDVAKDSISLKQDGMMQVLYKKHLDRLTQQASKFICVSEYLKKRAIDFGFPAEKCVVNYMGIPLTPPPYNQSYRANNSKKEPFRILSVGRLIPLKGHEKLIEAVALVEEAGHNVQLDIIGDGPLRDTLEKKASAKLKNYKFWGGQTHNQILSTLSQSNIFCHLSRTTENGQSEAFGLVISEAQWAGLPVVAFHSGGIPESIADGKTGILCAENNIAEVRDAICALITNRDLYSQMSTAAPEFIRLNFDGSMLTRKLETIYDEVITKAGHQ